MSLLLRSRLRLPLAPAPRLLRLCSSQSAEPQLSLGAQFQQLQHKGRGSNALKLSALVALLQQCRAPEHAKFPFLLVDLYQRKGQDFSEEAASHFIQVHGCFELCAWDLMLWGKNTRCLWAFGVWFCFVACCFVCFFGFITLRFWLLARGVALTLCFFGGLSIGRRA